MKVVIAGAGIGGLTLALMLHQRGIECELFESVRELKPLGVGINLLPHAANEMHQLGLLDTLKESGVQTSALHYYNCHGQAIWQEPRGLAAGYPVPQVSIHRGELQMHLAQAVRQHVGAAHIHTGMAFESARQDNQGVTALFRHRESSELHEIRADLLIGADGIHSAVRRFLAPANNELQFSGRMLWRAVTEAEPYLDGRTMFMAGHQDQKFVCYPISEPLRQKGRSLINWIAELRVPNGQLPSTDWNRQVDAEVFSAPFQSWRWDWIDIPAIIGSAQAIYEFPLVDKDPLPRWAYQRIALLGDAAHPMYPIGSNGSAQAILDARYLADRLAACANNRHEALTLALKEYEAERLPITAGIVLRNRLNGPEHVMQIAHERAPDGFKHIHDVVPEIELNEISLRYKRLAGFDPSRFGART
jgi:2-polyprenyl-6-methoxyphenol hydroxylase-like FAD-dependent oxidoreductase